MRSMLAFWMGGASSPVIEPATFVAGSIRIYPALSVTGAEIGPATEGSIQVRPATGGAPNVRGGS